MGMPRLWIPETEAEMRARRMDALAPDRSIHARFAGEQLPRWSPEAEGREQRARAYRLDTTAQDRVQALRTFLKGSQDFVRAEVARCNRLH